MHFDKNDRKIDLIRRYLACASGERAAGVAQRGGAGVRTGVLATKLSGQAKEWGSRSAQSMPNCRHIRHLIASAIRVHAIQTGRLTPG